MSRILIAGLCPLPFEDALRNEGPGIRTWQFALGLARAGHHVQLVAWRIPGAYGQAVSPATETREGVSIERVDEASFFNPDGMRRTIERLDPDALVGATIHGSYALARCRTDLPFWADQFGHTMAEAQAKAALDGNNSVLAYYWRRVETVMRRADRISVVSTRQRYAAIGELGALGRLGRETCGEDLVAVIPCAAMDLPRLDDVPIARGVIVPADAFIVLWSGGFNVWSDVETLFRGLEAAMARNGRIRFIATGAGIPGQDVRTYARFQELVAASPHRERFRLAGWLRSQDMVRYVADADLGLLTERPIYEGELGSKNRVLQWMAAGLPVAYNRVGDLGDLLADRDVGLTFAPGDSAALAERLVWAAENGPRLKEMAAAAQGLALREFAVETTMRPLTSWAEAPSPAPDASIRGRIQTPLDHAPVRSRIAALADRVGIHRRGRSDAETVPVPDTTPPASDWLVGLGVALLVLLPSLVWILRDRSVWPWDQAWYGWNSVDLYEAWQASLRGWLRAMRHVLGFKPPAVVWIGQWFVPLGRVLGLNRALLLSIWLTHAAALVLVWKTIVALAHRRDLACLGVLTVAAAPLFIWLSTQYMSEASQTLAVCWFLWILSQSEGWSRGRLGGHLMAATAFAMLAKASSPLYCFLPGLLAAWRVVHRRSASASRDARRQVALALALGAVLSLAALAWYAVNIRGVLAHASVAATGPIAELYGKRDTFYGSLLFWLGAARRASFLPWLGALVGASAGLGILGQAWRGARREGFFGRCALVSGTQIVAVLIAFSFSSNRDPRYLCPALPHLALVLSWAVSSLPMWAPRLLLLTGAAQCGYVHVDTLRYLGPRPYVAIQQIEPDRARAALLEAIVSRTCTTDARGRPSIAGADLPWFNGHSASYLAATLRIERAFPIRCQYVSIAYGELEPARRWVKGLDPVYWISLDPALYPIPASDEFLNQSSQALFQELRSQRRLVQEPAPGLPGVGVFRFSTLASP